MKLSDISIALEPQPQRGPMRAYVQLVIDGWLKIADLKITEKNGQLVLWFPQRGMKARCAACYATIEVRHRYCYHCGEANAAHTEDGKHFQSVAHPICHEARKEIERAVFAAYRKMVEPPGVSLADRVRARAAS